ncbi:MAG: thiamine pyrophosphate-binding protein, partial [Deltaproteobacteria bacterium]|nr:thiamine pyrophosphate-binding protein [Deltaproteobacteria bacterium]
MKEITYGGRTIGEALVEQGVECLFGIHGVINLAVEEACRLGVKMYHFRHEQSAGFAADAYARCLRKPGICFASTAPGFWNYGSAIAQANGALSPVVLLVGQHGAASDQLCALQEGYATEVFKSITKYTHRCTDWNMNSFWVRKAINDSMNYPPGPVVLEFPFDNLNAKGENRQQKYIFDKTQVIDIPQGQGDPHFVEEAVTMLSQAKRPLLVTGDGVYWSRGENELKEFAELMKIPVHSRRTGRGAVSEDHPLAVTGGTRAHFLKNADVICIIGLRATFLEEWFEPPDWTRHAKYIQIQQDPNEFWHALPTEVGIVGSSKLVLRQMIDCARSGKEHVPDRKDSFTATGYLTDKLEVNYAGQILDAGYHQALGQGIGMAIGAQVARPGRQVLALQGDGGFGISCMDMETLMRYKLPAVIVLFNNSSWGGRSLAKNIYYPNMASWDNLPGIRYDKMFSELGIHTEYVENPEDARPALERSFNSGLPSLVHVVGDTDELHPIRMRLNMVDVWTRGDIKDLPSEVKDEFKV